MNSDFSTGMFAYASFPSFFYDSLPTNKTTDLGFLRSSEYPRDDNSGVLTEPRLFFGKAV